MDRRNVPVKLGIHILSIGIKSILLGALVCGLMVAIMLPGLSGDFLFDDYPNIVQNETLHLRALSFETLRDSLSGPAAGPLGRPVSVLTLALTHYFFGLDPFAFKAVNLAIHAACALLIFFLALRLLVGATLQVKNHNALIAAGVVATAWLLHPIQLTPVLHVVQRMTSLSALFLLAALLLHISAREHGGRAGAVRLIVAWGVMWPLSFLSKETGALFPMFALAWELIVRRSKFGHLDRFARGFATVTGLTLLAVIAYGLSSRGQWLWAGYEMRAFSLGERILTEGRVLWFYLGLILFPRLEALGLYHDDIALSANLITPWTTLPAFAGLVGLVWVAWRLRTGAPLVAFGIAWFLIGHGVESTVLPLEIAHEHRNYLPLFGILLAGAWALIGALQSKGVHRTIGITLAAMTLANFAFVTALRAHQFGDGGRRTQIEAQHHRTSALAQYEAGRFMAAQAEAASSNAPIYSLAGAHYQLACDLDPNFKLCWLGLIHLSCKAGQPVAQAWIKELARRLRETPFAPSDRTVLYNMKEMSIAGAICLTRPDIDALFAAALANPSVSPGVQAMLHSWHADYLWLQANDLPAAGAALGQSLKLNPANPSNRLKWAQLLFIAGERAPARQLLLDLRDANLTAEERKTLNELLAAGDMAQP